MGHLFSKLKFKKKDDSDQDKSDKFRPPAPPPAKTKPVVLELSSNPIVIAMYNFNPRGPTELRFDKGDKIEILSQHGEDWWRGRHITTKEEGYFPVNYIASLATLDSQDWYFGNISRDEAENLLVSLVNSYGSFLVRASLSDSKNHNYTLSVRVRSKGNNNKKVKHFRIMSNKECYFNIAGSETFLTLNDLVDAHVANHAQGGVNVELTAPCKRSVPVINNLTPDNQWEISMDTLKFDKKIGSGTFGEVWVGTWNHQVQVAIKSLVRDSNMSHTQFLEEATIMKELRHSNILPLYGVCSNDYPLLIVTEYMANGALLDYLRRDEQHLPINHKIYIATQVASGMSYLEQKQLIHRDIAARNVLVGESLRCKIADFGLARLLHGDDVYNISSNLKIPLKWTAPEAFTKNFFTIKSDVWSFGILCYEIFSDGAIPYPGIHKNDVLSQVENGYRNIKPPKCPDVIYEMMYSCWNIEMERRPTFEYILDILNHINIYEERSYDEFLS